MFSEHVRTSESGWLVCLLNCSVALMPIHDGLRGYELQANFEDTRVQTNIDYVALGTYEVSSRTPPLSTSACRSHTK